MTKQKMNGQRAITIQRMIAAWNKAAVDGANTQDLMGAALDVAASPDGEMVSVPRAAWELWRAECHKPQFLTISSGGGQPCKVTFAYTGEEALKRGQGMHDAITAIALAAQTALASAPRSDAAPIDMLLFCPACGKQHIDAPDARTPDWKNPPHKSHLCHFCKAIWRPADVPTNGVEKIETRGKADTWVVPLTARPDADAKLAEIRKRHDDDEAEIFADTLSVVYLAIRKSEQIHRDRAYLLSVASEALQECERLRAALNPFADELDGAWGGLALDHEPIENFAGVNIRVGDLRKARACLQSALSTTTPAPEGGK